MQVIDSLEATEFLSYYPLKQGLKLTAMPALQDMLCIFILLSIKTRIETESSFRKSSDGIPFLSYYPLKQGLKPHVGHSAFCCYHIFLSYYPLKQGLKRCQ